MEIGRLLAFVTLFLVLAQTQCVARQIINQENIACKKAISRVESGFGNNIDTLRQVAKCKDVPVRGETWSGLLDQPAHTKWLVPKKPREVSWN